MKDQLWWVAATQSPTEDEAKRGERTSVILQPQVVVAKNDGEASLIAARLIPATAPSDRVEVVVVPFAQGR